MIAFVSNLFLALIWAAAAEDLSFSGLVVGYALAYLILWLMQPVTGPSRYFSKVWQATSFVLFFIWELVLANLRVAHDVITPTHHMKPGVLAIPLEAETELEITLLANLITLTPGSLSLDVSEDRSMLYIHAMYIEDPDALRQEIKNGFERRLLELLR